MHHGETAMTSGNPAVVNQPALPDAAEPDAIETRFGRLVITREQRIEFPNGLLGMPDATLFGITAFASPKMARFTLLQSLEDHALSFITLPLSLENGLIAADDLAQAAGDLNIPLESLVTFLIVTVSRDNGAAQLWVNARAPVFLDRNKRLAGQYVFPHNKYEIRHKLAM